MNVLAAGGTESVTLITGGLLALAALVSPLVPIYLFRRQARKEALDEARAAAASSGDLALSGWSTLNAALQQEITRLQGVVERMQTRIDKLSSDLEQLRNLALGTGERPPPDA